MKSLIINADDFGFTRDVNAGIVEAHRSGVLTSATLMANGDAFADAVQLASECKTLDVGVHLVFVQGASLLTGKPLPATPRQLLPALIRGELDVYAEGRAQIQKIMESGIRPTHVDTHKHTHLLPWIFRAASKLAQEFGIAYVRLPPKLPRGLYRRLARRYDVSLTDHFLGFELTGSLTENTLLRVLRKLPEGSSELMCHPGRLGPELAAAETRLKESRVRELEALTSPGVRRFIDEAGVRLRPFGGNRREVP